MDRDKITKPSSQCSFIGFVLLPLFEALASFFPELEPLIIDPVKYALDYYRKLNEASQQANRHRKSTTEIIGINTQPSSTANSTPASGSTEPDGAPPLSPPAVLSSTSGKCTQFVASSPKVFNPSNDNSSNLCDNKVPSDPCSVNRVSRSNSVSMPSSTSHSDRVGGSGVRPDDQNQPEMMMNPIAIAHRRASQLLIRGSGSVSSLKSALTTRSGPGYFTSFPSLESDSEREGETDEDEDAITEVAVSEKALKFKIATESSFDYTSISSRKGSRENKSESSGQSTSGQSSSQHTVGGSSSHQHNYNNNSILREEPAGSSTIVLSPRSSTPKLELSGVCCASAGVTDLTLAKLVTATASAGVEGVVMGRSSEGLAHHSGSSASTPVGEEGRGNVAGGSGSPASGSQSTAAKSKAKESFFSRLKLFTDRLSSGGDGGGTSGLGGSSQKVQSQGFNYFKRGGRKAGGGRNKSCVAHLDDRPCSSSSASIGGGGRKGKHRGSNSDPEGRDEFLRRHHTIHHTSEHYTQSEGERDYSELASPDCSPALSSRDSESYSRKGSSWKQCSGSLDSILSKEDSKRSPGRRLQMLPRFSSFVHKRTRMGFMRRLSPKNNTEPKS